MKKTDPAALERYEQEHGRCLGVAALAFRTDKGLTRSEVAKRAKVSVLWIKRLETNQLRTNYSIGRLHKVALALEVELYDLYNRAGEMTGLPPWMETEGHQNDE